MLKQRFQEIDELVDEWVPEPLALPLDAVERSDLDAIPVLQGANGPKPKLLSTGKTVTNLASYNFAGLAGNEHIKERAIETLRKYGLGSCGPPGFYGTIGMLSAAHLFSSFLTFPKMYTWISNAILRSSSAQNQPSCIHKHSRLSHLSSRRSASVETSSLLTVVSTSGFKRASSCRARQSGGLTIMIFRALKRSSKVSTRSARRRSCLSRGGLS